MVDLHCAIGFTLEWTVFQFENNEELSDVEYDDEYKIIEESRSYDLIDENRRKNKIKKSRLKIFCDLFCCT